MILYRDVITIVVNADIVDLWYGMVTVLVILGFGLANRGHEYRNTRPLISEVNNSIATELINSIRMRMFR